MKSEKWLSLWSNLKEKFAKWDRNFIYLGVVIIIILIIMIVHSAPIPNINNYSFGFCNYSISCRGIPIGNVCLGGKIKSVSCINPEKINNTKEYTYKMAELKCALEANILCKNESINGLEWVPLSSYENKSCGEWKKEFPQIKLLNCDQTFADVTQYHLLK